MPSLAGKRFVIGLALGKHHIRLIQGLSGRLWKHRIDRPGNCRSVGDDFRHLLHPRVARVLTGCIIEHFASADHHLHLQVRKAPPDLLQEHPVQDDFPAVVGKQQKPLEKKEFDDVMRAYGITLKRKDGFYDGPYVWSMAKSDYLGKSIIDEQHLAMFVRDYIDDEDGNPTRAFDEFIANCNAKGVDIPWADLI